MVFSSIPFIFYFAPAFLALLVLSRNSNWAVLFGSILFYTWGEAKWLPLLTASVVGNFFVSKLIERSEGRRRVFIFSFAVLANLSPLVYFKYYQFFLDNITGALGTEPVVLNISLPLGISFFTFQAISYNIDVYRSNIISERKLIDYATYIFLFPHLIAGPIVRYADISHELKYRSIDTTNVALGIQYFIVGLCQKAIIANTLAVPADHVFSLSADQLSMLDAWIGSLAYMFQLYFDFCGYSNMAIGLAFMMGFRFPRNFDYPYASRSISEFWRRWHISLSFWFRDYVYLPLGGSRVSLSRIVRNVLIVFALTGLWHGAAWPFVVWGLYHGAFVVFERIWLGSKLARLPSIVQHSYALLVVMVGWIIFRSTDIEQALGLISALVGFGGAPLMPMQTWLSPEATAALIAAPIFAIPTVPFLMRWLRRPEVDGALAYPNRLDKLVTVHLLPVSVLIAGFCISVALLSANSLNPFLYFRF